MLEDLMPPKRVYSCKVRRIAGELDATDGIIFMQAIDDSSNWTATGLSSELAKRGVDIGEKVIRKHRMNECSC
jgi:hypothetical protein